MRLREVIKLYMYGPLTVLFYFFFFLKGPFTALKTKFLAMCLQRRQKISN